MGGGHRGSSRGRHRHRRGPVPDPGGAAFYGPKISVQAGTRSAGPGRCRRSRSTSTSRGGWLEYTARTARGNAGDDPPREFGSMERFFGVLMEHYAAVPAWLAPVQVVAIPIAGAQRLPAEGSRASGGPASGSGSTSRRPDAEEDPQRLQKVPFMLIAGDRRHRGRRGVLPVPRRQAGQRRIGGRRDRPRRSTRWSAGSGYDPGRPGDVRRGARPPGTGSASPTSSTGCGPRTGWPTSAGRTSRPTPRRGPVPVLPGPDGSETPRAWSCTAASSRTPCSTCTPTAPGT